MKRSLNSRNDPFWWSRQLAQMAKKTMCVFFGTSIVRPPQAGLIDEFSASAEVHRWDCSAKCYSSRWCLLFSWWSGAPSEWKNKRVYWCSWIGSVIDWGIADTSRGIIQDVPFSRPTLCTKHYSPANQHGWLENHQNLKRRYESLDRLLFHCHDLVCWRV